MATKKPALGRGLSALLENAETDITNESTDPKVAGSIAMLSIDQVEANPFQPRTTFEKEALLELADSIKQHGIIQPITVRKLGYDQYQLISGERRFKASQLVGLKEIPAYIRIANDQTMLEMALVENIQRQDLDSIEVALSFQRLIDECDLTQEQLSEKVGKDRSTVTNYLRLLKLPAEIQKGIRDRKITMGHARALIGMNDEALQLSIFQLIIAKNLSVRDVEILVRGESGKIKPTTGRSNKPDPIAISMEHQLAKEELARQLNTKVELKRNARGKGKIVIDFSSDSELQRILDILYE